MLGGVTRGSGSMMIDGTYWWHWWPSQRCCLTVATRAKPLHGCCHGGVVRISSCYGGTKKVSGVVG